MIINNFIILWLEKANNFYFLFPLFLSSLSFHKFQTIKIILYFHLNSNTFFFFFCSPSHFHCFCLFMRLNKKIWQQPISWNFQLILFKNAFLIRFLSLSVIYQTTIRCYLTGKRKKEIVFFCACKKRIKHVYRRMSIRQQCEDLLYLWYQ